MLYIVYKHYISRIFGGILQKMFLAICYMNMYESAERTFYQTGRGRGLFLRLGTGYRRGTKPHPRDPPETLITTQPPITQASYY